MPDEIRVRNARGELIVPTKVSASDAKNAFGRILERVTKDGGVTITRRSQPFAVVIPIDTYARLAQADAGHLDTLSSEFDAMLERMQAPGVAHAMHRAFDMETKELSRAALGAARHDPRHGAASHPRKAAAAKRVRRR